MRLLAFDPIPAPAALDLGVGNNGSANVVLPNRVISCCPLAAGKHHLLNHAAFDQNENGVMVGNTNRGALIDSRAAIGSEESENRLAGDGCV